MARPRKQHLKRRPDGRYACRYKGQFFYGATEAEALAARDAYKQAEKSGIVPWDTVTVSQYAAAWLPVARPNIAECTYRGLAAHLDHLCKCIGDVPISEVRPLQIKGVYTSEYLGRSQSYILSAKQLYTALFESALENGLIRINPAKARDAQPHKGTVGGHRAITAQERWWIDHYCAEHRARPAVMAMLYAGLRPQEVKALHVERDVDFDRGLITLHEFIHRDDENQSKYVLTETGKTERAARTIPLLDPLRGALQDCHGYIVQSAHGEQINPTTWRVMWNSYLTEMETAINGCQRRWYGKTKAHKALLAAGESLPPWNSFQITPYDLRHSFCTMCRDNGVEINTCIKWMGHADAKMILKVYDSVSDDRFQAEAERLNASFGSQNGSQIKKKIG